MRLKIWLRVLLKTLESIFRPSRIPPLSTSPPGIRKNSRNLLHDPLSRIMRASALIKEKFWEKKGWFKRIAGNGIVAIVLGLAFIAGWHYIPKPKEPPTADEIARRVAALMPVPQFGTSTAPPTPSPTAVPATKTGPKPSIAAPSGQKGTAAFAGLVEYTIMSYGGRDYDTGYWVRSGSIIRSWMCFIAGARRIFYPNYELTESSYDDYRLYGTEW